MTPVRRLLKFFMTSKEKSSFRVASTSTPEIQHVATLFNYYDWPALLSKPLLKQQIIK